MLKQQNNIIVSQDNKNIDYIRQSRRFIIPCEIRLNVERLGISFKLGGFWQIQNLNTAM
jgi:hypothetical protein